LIINPNPGWEQISQAEKPSRRIGKYCAKKINFRQLPTWPFFADSIGHSLRTTVQAQALAFPTPSAKRISPDNSLGNQGISRPLLEGLDHDFSDDSSNLRFFDR